MDPYSIYIGLEMGTVYNALGSQVTVVEFMPNLLPGADEDLVKPLASILKKSFENIYLSTKVSKVEPTDNEVTVHFEGTEGKEGTKEGEQKQDGKKPSAENKEEDTDKKE